jgi:hypothetical protein
LDNYLGIYVVRKLWVERFRVRGNVVLENITAPIVLTAGGCRESNRADQNRRGNPLCKLNDIYVNRPFGLK